MTIVPAKRTITMNLTEKDIQVFNRIVDEKELESRLAQSQILRFVLYDYCRLITGDESITYQPHSLNYQYTEKERRYFAKHLRDYRHEHHLSQDDLAKRLNVSSSSISFWESGGTPHQNGLKKIAKEMKCSIENLFKGVK